MGIVTYPPVRLGPTTVQGSMTVKGDMTVQGQTTSVDNVATTDVVVEDANGNEQFRIDGDAATPFFEMNNHPMYLGANREYSIYFDPNEGTSGALLFEDEDNSDVEMKYFIGGGIEYSNQSIETRLNEGEDIWKLIDTATSDTVRYFFDGTGSYTVEAHDDSAGVDREIYNINPSDQQLNMVGTLNFPSINGTPTFAGHTHDEAGMDTIPNAGLTNSTIGVGAGNGLTGGGTPSLGGSTTIDVGDGQFITVNNDSVDVNIGNGLEGDGSDNVRVSGGAIAGNALTEGANPYQVDVDSGSIDTTELAEPFNALTTLFGTPVTAGGDGEKVVYGSAPDFGVRYDSGDDELVWNDEVNGDDVMAIDKAGNLQIQGTLTESTTV